MPRKGRGNQVVVRLDDAELGALDKLAEQFNLTRSDIIRLGLAAYVERGEL